MAEAVQFTMGAKASCSDGPAGVVSRVVVDPITRKVTHLVVEPKHRQGLGRLVPLDLVEVTPEETKINCTQDEFNNLLPAEETQFLSAINSFETYETGNVLYHPFYSMDVGSGPGTEMSGLGIDNLMEPVTLDLLPEGEVAIGRGESVQATDGSIGKVQGLVIDPRNRRVTHVLLQEGHLWGKREVAIPIQAVSSVEHGVQLNVSKAEIGNLAPVGVNDFVG